MKKVIILFLVFAIVVAVVCSTFVAANREEKIEVPIYWQNMPENTNPNLQYFGYYHFDSYIKTVADYKHSNICKIDGNDTDTLTELLDNGFQVFIMIRYMFFKDGETPADWEQRWNAVKAVINPHIGQIMGFYVDEPIRRNIGSTVNIGKSMASFHFACQKVLEDYPDKRMMSVLTIDDINNPDYSREYYQYCTDLGYDFYPRWSVGDVRKYIGVLEDEIAVGGQDIWLIPKGFYTVDYESDLYGLIEDTTIPIGKDVMDWIKGTYKLAIADHRVVGIYAFSYDDHIFTVDLRRFFTEGSEYYNEEIYGVYNQIGHAIIDNY